MSKLQAAFDKVFPNSDIWYKIRTKLWFLFPRVLWGVVTRRLGKVWRFARLGWEDHDFDQEFLGKVIIFKLREMERFFKSDLAMTMNAPRRAVEMAALRRQFERLSWDAGEAYPEVMGWEEEAEQRWKKEAGKARRPKNAAEYRRLSEIENEVLDEVFNKIHLILRRRYLYWWD